ncbi:6-phospho-3-hexuloisomerase [Salmonella enterica subsp. enterica serovar Choleraesuis]|nr:6-phospho-3-hexuloisomerase [Salmonella enterica subsp. enterica serovar Choleraesuis]
MKNFTLVTDELTALIGRIDPLEFDQLIYAITHAGHIYLAGAGRSGQMVGAFANRLMHLGFTVSMVGEISSPHSRQNDLMIIGSGSGETQRLINQAGIAKKNGVRIALITTAGESTLARLADCKLIIPATDSVQPMGTLFEQASLLVYDSIILALMARLNETADSMKRRHADIE